MTDMPAIILAGGFGTRLKEVVSDVPKPMAPVDGKPFLEYLIAQLIKWNVRDVILSVGYKRDVIKAYFGTGERWGIRIRYAEEDAPLGTGGAIFSAAHLTTADTLLVLNGDSFFSADFQKLVDFHTSTAGLVTMALVQMNDTGRYGRVEVGPDGAVTGFVEKKGESPGLINSGVYVVSRTVLTFFPPSPSSFEQDVIPKIMHNNFYACQLRGDFIDIGIPEDYERAAEFLNKMEWRLR